MINSEILVVHTLIDLARSHLKKARNEKKSILLERFIHDELIIKTKSGKEVYKVYCFVTLLLYTEDDFESYKKKCPVFTLSYTMESPNGSISDKLYFIPILKNIESNIHFIVFENKNVLNKGAASCVISAPPCTFNAPINFFLNGDLPPEKSLHSVFEPIKIVLDQFIINMNPTLIDCNIEVTLIKVKGSTVYKNYQPFY